MDERSVLADTMSPIDASFLYIENEVNHMHIASVAIFEGPPPKNDEIEQMISSKLHLVPRYRQRVSFVPLEIGRPVWTDDPHFNLTYHLRHSALPSPGTDEQLRTLVGRVMSQKLDRAKPLWEIWVVEGLAEDRWAMLSKTHHCMVDGVAGTDLMSVLMDQTPDVEHPPARPWQPSPPPSNADLLRRAIRSGIARPREGLSAIWDGLRAPGRLLSELEDLSDGLATFRSFGETEAETSLNGPIGPHRRWCWASTTIADVKKIRSAHGGTVNDVVLAAISQGFRKLMISRGEPVEGRCVRSLVPVSVRREEERGRMDNRVSAMFAELPMDMPDPRDCLARIHEQMEGLKAHHQADAAESVGALTDFAPPVFLALAGRAFASLEQHAVQTVTTNVPGPRLPLFAGGRRMLCAYPYVPLAGSVRIAIAIFSYAGQLNLGITGDYESAPDIDLLGHAIETSLSELLEMS